MTTTTTALMSSVGDGPPPLRSTTSITAGRTYHVLKIHGYSSTLKVGHGKALLSCPFTAGGRTWYISYYPNGRRDTYKDSISFFIHLDDTVNDDVMAQVTFSLLDQHENPVRSRTHTTSLYNFSVASTRAFGFVNFITRDDLQRSGYLNDDCFAIAVHLVITEEPRSPSVTVPPSNMHLHYGDLLSSKEGSDVEFVVGGETFAAHRLVLATRSPVFKAELFKPMEGGTTDVIKIDDMDAQVFKALLVFIYTDTWLEIGQAETTMVQLLVAANKYSLSRLKIMCEDRLCNYIDTGSVATMLVLADKYHCHGLKKVCFSFLASSRTLSLAMKEDNFQCLIQSRPNMLKDVISNIIAHQLEIKLSA